MAIKPITQSQFDSFGPVRGPMPGGIGIEKAWFADENDTLIGAIIFNTAEKDWTYALLACADDGQLRWVNGGSFFPTQDEAERKLKAKMSEMEKSN